MPSSRTSWIAKWNDRPGRLSWRVRIGLRNPTVKLSGRSNGKTGRSWGQPDEVHNAERRCLPRQGLKRSWRHPKLRFAVGSATFVPLAF